MIILVSDASVLIDLERGSLLEAALSCRLTRVVPDLLYERELAADNGSLLRRLGNRRGHRRGWQALRNAVCIQQRDQAGVLSAQIGQFIVFWHSVAA
jgi:hypothetical protein